MNKYVDENAPWKINVDTIEDRERLEEILFIVISHLRKIAIMLLPFFDSKMHELLIRIGTPYNESLSIAENLSIDPNLFFIAEK